MDLYQYVIIVVNVKNAMYKSILFFKCALGGYSCQLLL